MQTTQATAPQAHGGHLGSAHFQDNARQALHDAPLQQALQLLVSNFVPRRVAAMAALGDPEALRTEARAIKARTIARLDEYLELFATQAEKLGVKVHWATDAAEAREIITTIVREADAKVIVKGKSMATEEIHLNPHLEQRGYEVVETDLGEYIIQLAGETPSHIIAPAIHKTREQVAALLHEKLGTPYTDVVQEMTQIAREALRERFLRADVGITGANFAIAETGSIVLVTNEGNGRLLSTMPRVHVALVGMEKVIPRLSDLAVMLKVLTNSATGQKISSYVTMLTGPRRAHDLDGPEELHVVLYITQLAQDEQVHTVVRWQSALLDALEVNTALQQQGVTVHTTTSPTHDEMAEPAAAALTTRRRALRELLAQAGLGLSGVDYVIAETGTLVLQACAGQMRGVSLLPPVHVAVARTSQVLATLADFLLLTQATAQDVQQQLTSCTSFITGPSRTADIELQLTVGVHGPQELHLILLDDPVDS